jgi:Zn finger protein HypA/HybF involved in hydrogenase expression
VEKAMGKCLKGESEVKKKDARVACDKCGAKSDKKGHLCKPEKLASGKKEPKKK